MNRNSGLSFPVAAGCHDVTSQATEPNSSLLVTRSPLPSRLTHGWVPFALLDG